MNTQRSRLSWLILSFLATLACVHCARAAVVGSVKGTNELYFNINPRSGNTNYMTIGDAGVVDGTAAIWSWDAAGSLDGSFDRVGSWYSVGSGAWVRNFTGINVGGTNIFNTIITTNLTVTTNLYITTNTFVIIGGDTNRVGLWTDFTTFIAPTFATNNYQITSTGVDGINDLFITSTQNPANSSQASGTTESLNETNVVTLSATVVSNSVPSVIKWIVDPGNVLSGGRLLQAFTFENVEVGRFEPSVDDGAGAVAWSFDTVNPLATGNVAAFKNDGTNVVAIGPLAQINFGEGGTNVLSRSGSATSHLLYTNGYEGIIDFQGLQPGIQAGVGVDAAGRAVLRTSGNFVALTDFAGAGEVFLNDKDFGASFDDMNLGRPASAGGGMWRSVYQKTNYVYGYDGLVSGDYARLTLSHGGTNDSILFNSESGGIAGDPRPFQFQMGGTNIIGIGPLAQINFGEGTTNVLYRNPATSALVYTNGSATVNFEVHDGAGDSTSLTVSTGVGTLLTSTAELLLGANGKTLDLNSGSDNFSPSQDGQIKLGTPGKTWQSLALTNTSSIYLGTNILGYSGNNLTWNGVNITVP